MLRAASTGSETSVQGNVADRATTRRRDKGRNATTSWRSQHSGRKEFGWSAAALESARLSKVRFDRLDASPIQASVQSRAGGIDAPHRAPIANTDPRVRHCNLPRSPRCNAPRQRSCSVRQWHFGGKCPRCPVPRIEAGCYPSGSCRRCVRRVVPPRAVDDRLAPRPPIPSSSPNPFPSQPLEIDARWQDP